MQFPWVKIRWTVTDQLFISYKWPLKAAGLKSLKWRYSNLITGFAELLLLTFLCELSCNLRTMCKLTIKTRQLIEKWAILLIFIFILNTRRILVLYSILFLILYIFCHLHHCPRLCINWYLQPVFRYPTFQNSRIQARQVHITQFNTTYHGFAKNLHILLQELTPPKLISGCKYQINLRY